jgi:hypothetical protein
MNFRNSIASMALAAALCVTLTDLWAQDVSKYPDWKGQWSRVVVTGVSDGLNPSFDQTKPSGFGQEAPLTAEYQKVLEESMADQARGGIGNYYTILCRPRGMPHMMTFGTHEYIITPEITYILLGGEDRYRRIFTDGRDWPKDLDPTFQGFSIGRWIDEDGDGRYNVLEVETRGPFKGPRAFDSTGLPLHFDNDSIFKERFYLDKANPNILHDEITTIDRALTRPWTVDKQYRRNPNRRAIWPENYCSVDTNNQIMIGKENYFLAYDGTLMPTRKDQPPPDLRYFKQHQK